MASTVPDRRDGDATKAAELETATMARYGIMRVPADQYHVGGYRYTSLADAVAQAKRAPEARVEP